MFDDQVSSCKSTTAKQDKTGRDVSKTSDKGSNEARQTGYALAQAKDREILTIIAMHGGRQYRRQLMDMGLRPGLEIKVMRAGRGGPVLISVGETRLGIGRDMAEKIEVVPIGRINDGGV